MDKEKKYALFGLFLIFLSLLLAILSVEIAYSISNERNELLRKEDIYSERLSVKMRDDIEIKGLLYLEKDLEKKEDNSVPTILLLHGVNGRKEHKLNVIFQFVKRGFAVFSVEQRGHGESGGFSSFLKKEPKDMEEIIDYIEKHYSFANVSHLALLGFSYGGGVGAILQAKDDRIYASVLYHPLVSLEHLTELMPFQNLIGISYGLGNLEDIQDGLKVCSQSNTKNLLLIHGEEDELISLEDSKDLYKKVGGKYRTDIGLEIIPNLNHFETEEDDEALKHAIVWLEHFYYDNSIDINNREYETSLVKFEDFEYPNTVIPDYLILLSGIILFLGLSFLIVPKTIWQFAEKSLVFCLKEEFLNINMEQKAYREIIFSNSVIYTLPTLILAPLFAIFYPSYIFGYSLFIPITTILVFLLIPKFENPDWKSEWKTQLMNDLKNWYRNHLKNFVYGLFIIIVPVFFYVSIFNYNAFLMTSFPIPFFNSTMILYLSMGISTFYMDYLLVKRLKFQHSFILIALRSLTLIIFFAFVPIPAFGFTGLPISGEIAQVLIFSLIGVVFWLIIIIMRLFKIIYKNLILVMLLFLLPLIIYLLFLLLRLV